MSPEEREKKLRRALNHLRVARSQFTEADDEIIRDHVETAIFLLEGREPGELCAVALPGHNRRIA